MSFPARWLPSGLHRISFAAMMLGIIALAIGLFYRDAEFTLVSLAVVAMGSSTWPKQSALGHLLGGLLGAAGIMLAFVVMGFPVIGMVLATPALLSGLLHCAYAMTLGKLARRRNEDGGT